MNTKKRHLVHARDVRKRSGQQIDHADVLVQLQEDRKNHLRELERLHAALAELPEASIEEADPAIAEQVQTRALIHQVEEHLQEIDRAIQAAYHADYGTCEHCGEPIDPERLKILPETRMCIKCKRESEKFTQHRFR